MMKDDGPRAGVLPRRALVPWWIALVLFVPVEVWLFFRIRSDWGTLRAALAIAAVAFVAARASRPRGLLAWIFPRRAERRARRRPVWLAALVVAAAATFALPWGPQPWLALLASAGGVKALVT